VFRSGLVRLGWGRAPLFEEVDDLEEIHIEPKVGRKFDVALTVVTNALVSGGKGMSSETRRG
jgi:hypothetical protein